MMINRFLHAILLFAPSFLVCVVMAAGPLPNLDTHITELRGDDDRLVRLDASPHTAEKQLDETICGKIIMDQVLSFIIKQNKNKEPSEISTIVKACEYITLCVIDNPTNRKIFGQHTGIHEAVIQLMGKLLDRITQSPELISNAISKLANIVYDTTFADPINHQAYITNGITSQLTNMIKGTVSRKMFGDDDEELHIPFPIITMWSNAALANILGSYCNTENDGQCYWQWYDNGLAIGEEFLPITSDGAAARESIIHDAIFIEYLIDMSCIKHAEHEDDIMVGSTARFNRDENYPVIVPWSSAAALFNLALHPSLREMYLETAIGCFCDLTQSHDWLEEEKSVHLLERTRRSYPCFFKDMYTKEEEPVEGEDGEMEQHEPEYIGRGLCINNEYYQTDGTTCDNLSSEELDLTEEDCAKIDKYGNPAYEACCICGGGNIIHDPTVHDEEHDGQEEEYEL